MRRLISMVVLTIVLLPLTVQAEFMAGAAKRSIVPPFPTAMGGYFDRTANFEGVDREVFARALVCRNEETAVAVMAADLIGVSSYLVEGARARVAAETGLRPENILISATHTHSAPSGFSGASTFGFEVNTELNAFLIEAFTGVIVDAWKALRPAAVGFAYGHLDGITTNRQQNNDQVIDSDVGVLKVQEKGSRNTIATLANFTGHPVILDSTNLLLSCEYPGVACETVEQVLGGVAIFTQGACGDVTMKRSGPKFEEVTRLGRVVAGEIIATSEQIAVGEETVLASQSAPITLEPRVLPAPEESEARIAVAEATHQAAVDAGKPAYVVRDLQREVNAARTTAMVARVAAEKPEVIQDACDTTWQVVQIGPMVAVGIPGEIFVEYALEMKARVAQDTGRPMILVGYANDYIGYIITPRAGETGGYERAISRVAPSAGRALTEAAMAAVRSIVVPAE
jgi:neutral ceramidase